MHPMLMLYAAFWTQERRNTEGERRKRFCTPCKRRRGHGVFRGDPVRQMSLVQQGSWIGARSPSFHFHMLTRDEGSVSASPPSATFQGEI
jgi:hypothetical protein